MLKIKFGRQNSLKETLIFNLILGFIIYFIPYFILSIIARELIVKDLKYIIGLFVFINLLAYLEFISRKNVIINKIFYIVYWAALIFGFMFFIFFVGLSIIALLFPLKWG